MELLTWWPLLEDSSKPSPEEACVLILCYHLLKNSLTILLGSQSSSNTHLRRKAGNWWVEFGRDNQGMSQFQPPVAFRRGSQGRDFRQLVTSDPQSRAERNVCTHLPTCWLMFSSVSSLFYVRMSCLGDSTTHSGPGLPSSVNLK